MTDGNWEKLDRTYQIITSVWFVTSVASIGLAIYVGPSWNAMLLAFLGGFQLSAGIATISSRRTAQVVRMTCICYEATIDQTMEALRVVSAANDGASPLDPSDERPHLH